MKQATFMAFWWAWMVCTIKWCSVEGELFVWECRAKQRTIIITANQMTDTNR